MDAIWNDWKDLVFDVAPNENPCVVLIFINENSAVMARNEMVRWGEITMEIAVKPDKFLTITFKETDGDKSVSASPPQTIDREHVVDWLKLSQILRYPIYFALLTKDDLVVMPQQEWLVFGKGYTVVDVN